MTVLVLQEKISPNLKWIWAAKGERLTVIHEYSNFYLVENSNGRFHINRDHSTAIHAFNTINQRIKVRDENIMRYEEKIKTYL